jgi:hypothetical protein
MILNNKIKKLNQKLEEYREKHQEINENITSYNDEVNFNKIKFFSTFFFSFLLLDCK